jgi:hypothetical protein
VEFNFMVINIGLEEGGSINWLGTQVEESECGNSTDNGD